MIEEIIELDRETIEYKTKMKSLQKELKQCNCMCL